MELTPLGRDEEWGRLLDAQPDATLYHTMPWLRFQERSFGYKLHPLVARRRGAPVGVFPTFLVRRGIFRVSSSPRGIDTLFLGPLVAPGLLPELLDAYDRWVRRNRVDYSAIAFPGEIEAEAATSRGYAHERQRNAVVDLAGGEEAVWDRLTSECRRRVRQARKRRVEIVEGGLGPHLDRYVTLSAETFARSDKRSMLTRDVLSDMLGALADGGETLALRAEVDGKVMAMYVGAAYRRTFYAVDTVCDVRFRKYPASNLMNWHALAWSCRRGLDRFDFQGANMPSLATFKASFGAALVHYSNITKAHSALARWTVWVRKRTVVRLRELRFRRSRKGRKQAGTARPSATADSDDTRAGPELDAGSKNGTKG